MFLANWFIAAQARNIGTHPRLTVPSSYFRAQSQAGNIDEVNSQGETIQGSFRHVITYPAGKRGQVTHPFKTERPASADDQLLQILVSENVAMNAKPITTGTSLVSEMLLAFGPTLLPS